MQEVLTENKTRSRSSKRNNSGGSHNNWTSAGEKKMSDTNSSSNNINRTKSSSGAESSLLSSNSLRSSSHKLTHKVASSGSNTLSSKFKPEETDTESSGFDASSSYSNALERNCFTADHPSDSPSYYMALITDSNQEGSDNKHSRNNPATLGGRSKFSGSGSVQGSRASTPSSNSNSLTKNKTFHDEECHLDEQELTASSPFFCFSSNGES